MPTKEEWDAAWEYNRYARARHRRGETDFNRRWRRPRRLVGVDRPRNLGILMNHDPLLCRSCEKGRLERHSFWDGEAIGLFCRVCGHLNSWIRAQK